ncbi:TFIIB-type zinc ribbon-containing protein [Paenibacillus sp. GYB003]|uniref:TFIIB-type zinc ribbon-containing protein n=1 Tax=Paenibacillus sp. GYB003 TaxID=2994392 RepID=UPI002F962F67
MNCPVCDGVKMREVEKDNIMIDICPSCKGVWLDRGELDKLMEGVREVREPFGKWYEDQDKYRQPSYDDRSHSYGKHDSHDPRYPKHKKKKNALDIFGDLFD